MEHYEENPSAAGWLLGAVVLVGGLVLLWPKKKKTKTPFVRFNPTNFPPSSSESAPAPASDNKVERRTIWDSFKP